MRLKGWRRLWAVGSVISFVLLSLLIPSWLTLQLANSNSRDRREIERDFKSSDCARFISDDFANLTYVPFNKDGGTCWEVYNARGYDRQRYGDQVPYTMSVYLENQSASQRDTFFVTVAIGSFASLFLSALVYGVGSVVARIIHGL
jgi:hypothetical protein